MLLKIQKETLYTLEGSEYLENREAKQLEDYFHITLYRYIIYPTNLPFIALPLNDNSLKVYASF